MTRGVVSLSLSAGAPPTAPCWPQRWRKGRLWRGNGGWIHWEATRTAGRVHEGTASVLTIDRRATFVRAAELSCGRIARWTLIAVEYYYNKIYDRFIFHNQSQIGIISGCPPPPPPRIDLPPLAIGFPTFTMGFPPWILGLGVCPLLSEILKQTLLASIGDTSQCLLRQTYSQNLLEAKGRPIFGTYTLLLNFNPCTCAYNSISSISVCN